MLHCLRFIQGTDSKRIRCGHIAEWLPHGTGYPEVVGFEPHCVRSIFPVILVPVSLQINYSAIQTFVQVVGWLIPETRFCDIKRSNNAIIVKILESEVDFRVLHSNDRTNLAMQLICITNCANIIQHPQIL